MCFRVALLRRVSDVLRRRQKRHRKPRLSAGNQTRGSSCRRRLAGSAEGVLCPVWAAVEGAEVVAVQLLGVTAVKRVRTDGRMRTTGVTYDAHSIRLR